MLPDQTSVDSAVKFVSNIMIETAKQAGMQMPKKAIPRRSFRAENSFTRLKQPKWQDHDCNVQLRNVKQISKSLQNDPNNPYLRGKLITENKIYKKLIKLKQRQFTENLFSQLETMHNSDPRKYMQLVNSLKNNSFDKSKPSDTAAISPEEWFKHFSSLLCKPSSNKEADQKYEEYFMNNVDNLASELDDPFSKKEYSEAIKRLKNNKATSFDLISNEMLKNGLEPMSQPLLLVFNTILYCIVFQTICISVIQTNRYW